MQAASSVYEQRIQALEEQAGQTAAQLATREEELKVCGLEITTLKQSVKQEAEARIQQATAAAELRTQAEHLHLNLQLAQVSLPLALCLTSVLRVCKSWAVLPCRPADAA